MVELVVEQTSEEISSDDTIESETELEASSESEDN